MKKVARNDWDRITSDMRGDHLSTIRRILGWTQQRMADHLGSSVSAIGLWERGWRIKPMIARAIVATAVGNGVEPTTILEILALPPPPRQIVRRGRPKKIRSSARPSGIDALDD